MPSQKPTYVSQPFLGLFLDRPAWQVAPAALIACNNVRITNGVLTSSLMGWTYTGVQLNGAVTLIADFPNNNNHQMVLGTPTDLYDWRNGTPVFITPAYTTGTASCTGGTAVTGVGTKWNTKVGLGWTRNNIMPGDKIYFGSALQNSTSATYFTVQSVTDDTHLVLTANGPNTGGQGTYTARQLASGDANRFHWDAELFPQAGPPLNSDAIFMTNGIDPVITWNGSDTFAKYQGSLPFTCFQMRRFKNLMIYGGLTFKGQLLQNSIANSDNGLPLNTASGVAGQFVVSDGPFTINHLGILGNNLMIYMGDIDGGSVVAAQFVGFPTIFVFTEVIRGRGPIASRVTLEFPDRHEFIAQDGQYRYNGLFVQLMNTQFWRVTLQNFDRSRSDRSISGIVPQFGLAHFALPLQTDPGNDLVTAYLENYLEQPQNYLFKPITQRDFPFTAVGQLPKGANIHTWDNPYSTQFSNSTNRWDDNTISGSYPSQYVGDSSGKIYTLFTADTKAGSGFSSTATFNQRIVAGERMRGLVRRIYPFMETTSGYNVNVTVTLYDQIGGAIAITDTQSFDPSYTGNRFTSHFRRGRLASVTFATPGSATGQPWTLDGYDWDISPGGQR